MDVSILLSLTDLICWDSGDTVNQFYLDSQYLVSVYNYDILHVLNIRSSVL